MIPNSEYRVTRTMKTTPLKKSSSQNAPASGTKGPNFSGIDEIEFIHGILLISEIQLTFLVNAITIDMIILDIPISANIPIKISGINFQSIRKYLNILNL